MPIPFPKATNGRANLKTVSSTGTESRSRQMRPSRHRNGRAVEKSLTGHQNADPNCRFGVSRRPSAHGVAAPPPYCQRRGSRLRRAGEGDTFLVQPWKLNGSPESLLTCGKRPCAAIYGGQTGSLHSGRGLKRTMEGVAEPDDALPHQATRHAPWASPKAPTETIKSKRKGLPASKPSAAKSRLPRIA